LRLFRFAASSFFALALFALALLPAGVHAEDIDLSTYHDPDFTIDYPAGWTVSGSESVSHVSGSLRTAGPCDRLTLSWIRDPGMDPKEILDQIEKAYNSGDVKVLSSEPGEMKMKDQAAKTLNLAYEFNGNAAGKLFAVWNSSRSDRLFLASFSSCNDSARSNLALFKELVASFADLGIREHAMLGPKPLDGAWPQVLGDLLSSYHYKEIRTLPGRTVHVKVGFELSPQDGSYVLDSREELWTDPPETAAARAGAVAQILQQAGYDARLAQARGEIAVAVLDPSKKWLHVSVNPASPERMVGVLANGTMEAVMYRDFADLAQDNGIVKGFDLDRLVQKDCEVSRYVELKAMAETNQSWLDGLREGLESYDYDKYYEENVFDCSNTAQICWSVLQQKGYDARLMMTYKGHPLDPHMWIVVRYLHERGGYVAVETANTDENKRLVHLGRLVEDAAYLKGIMYNSSLQFSRLHPEEGMNLKAL